MNKVALAQAFSRRDFSESINYIKEDTVWEIVGDDKLEGKTAIIDYSRRVKSYFETVEANFQNIYVIESEHAVVINGTVEFCRNGRVVAKVAACEVFVFDENKHFQTIHTYYVMSNSNSLFGKL